jgi:hypothetical protein
MSRKAAATASGVWTAEEEKKLTSAVDTLGATSWAKIAANVLGRNEIQCSRKWWNMSRKATAAASAAWAAEVRECKSTLFENGPQLDPTEPAGVHDYSFSGDAGADHSSGCNTTVEDFGDSMPSNETTTDGYTSGDEPPKKTQ